MTDIDDSQGARLRFLAEQGAEFQILKLDDPSSMTEFTDKVKRVFPALYFQGRQLGGEKYGHLMHVAQMSYSWGQCGFPAYQLTHGLAAALMLTDPPELPKGEKLRLPKRTFCLLLPPGVVPVFTPDGQKWADLIWVNQSRNIHASTHSNNKDDEEGFLRWLVEHRSVSVWRDRKPEDIYEDIDERTIHLDDGELGPEDDVTLWGAMKLIRNFLSWAEATGAIENYKRPLSKRRKGKKPGRGRKPRADVLQLGRGVKLSPELREAASEIALGRSKHAREGWQLRAQHLVRGHWRNQAHGPDRALRKLIWIEPHWRGPEGKEAWNAVLGG